MTSEKDIHPGPKRKKVAAAFSDSMERFWNELVSDFWTYEEKSFLCNYLLRKNPKRRDIVNFAKTYLYDVETGRRRASNLPAELLLGFSQYKNSPLDFFVDSSPRKYTSAEINQLLEHQSDFLIPISVDMYTGRILFLRSKTSHHKGKEIVYINLDIPECYPDLFYSDLKESDEVKLMCGVSTFLSFDKYISEVPRLEDDLCFSDYEHPFNLTESMEAIPPQYRMYFHLKEAAANENKKLPLEKQISMACP